MKQYCLLVALPPLPLQAPDQASLILPAVLSNCSNNYGPHQFVEKLIPLTILKCLTADPGLRRQYSRLALCRGITPMRWRWCWKKAARARPTTSGWSGDRRHLQIMPGSEKAEAVSATKKKVNRDTPT
jgi:hypothetical protein